MPTSHTGIGAAARPEVAGLAGHIEASCAELSAAAHKTTESVFIGVVENGAANAPLITLPVNTLGERGVSGLAVDPDFASNGHLYVAYTTSTVRNRLSQLMVDGNPAGSELALMQSAESEALNLKVAHSRSAPMPTACATRSG